MALFDATLGLGVGFLLAVALAQYAKVKSAKGWQLIGVAAAMFLFSAAWTAPAVVSYLSSVALLKEVFELLGWLFALIGAIFVVYESLLEVF
jgi:lipid-A-disaccharide synthase-like uncharacterized protein